MDKIGVELQLKQNLDAQLKIVLPLLEKMNKQTAQLEQQLYQAKGTKEINRQLGHMVKQLNSVGAANRSLVNTIHALDRVGDHAARSAHKVGLLGRAMRGIAGAPMALAGMMGSFASVYAVGDMFKHGMDFDQKMVALKSAGFSPKNLDLARKTAKETAAMPGMMTTPTEVADSMRIGYAITRSQDEAIRMAPLGAQFNRSMRQLNAPHANERDQSEFAFKMAEQLGVRTESGMKSLMDDLTKVQTSFVGQVDLAKLTTQMALTRTGKYGADTLPLLTQLSHVLTEAGSGSGGGARAGMMYQAVQRAFHQGVMPQSVAERLAGLGLLNGYDTALSAKSAAKAAKHHGATGTYFKEVDGQVVQGAMWSKGKSGSGGVTKLSKAELGNLVITGLKGGTMARQNFPEWVYKTLVPAIEKKEHKEFYKLDKGGQVDLLIKYLAGLQVNAQDLVTQLALQRKVYEGQLAGAKAAPGMEGLAKEPLAMRLHMEQMTKAWETFGTTLTSNEHTVSLVNNIFDTLTHTLLNFTAVVDPVMKFFDQMNNMFNGWIGGAAGGLANTASQAGQLGQALFPEHSGRLATHTAKGGDWAEQFRKTHSDGVAKSGILVPAPPANAPMMVDPQMAKLYSNYSKTNGIPMSPPPPQVNVTVNHTTNLDGKNIAKHTTKHVAKAMAKTGRTMSQSVSDPGGSHTPKYFSQGGGQ